MSNTIIMEVSLEDGETINIDKKRKAKIPMRFEKYGLKGYTMGMDAVKMITEMTKPEQKVFILLRDNNISNSNETYITTAGLKRSQQLSQRKAINLLKAKDIIREINTKEYMFNPEFLVPNGDYFKEIKEKYELIKP